MAESPADAQVKRTAPHANPSFNLVDAPWLRVRMVDGSAEVMSLGTLFTRMDAITVLDGESPTQNTASLRLLMAVLIRALRNEAVIDPKWNTARIWRAISSATDLKDIVADYLASCHERFDMFDPIAPFFQVAGLETKKGDYSDASVLVPDVGPGLFSTRTRDDARVLDAASAARWLVRLHAYDLSGIKSGALGDPRVKGGKGYPIGTGWAGAIGSIMLSGPTLRDTLLLNLPVHELKVADDISGLDLPPWERDPDSANPRNEEEVEPIGVVDLLTWQQRRVRLFPAGSSAEVERVLICNGDKIARANRIEEPYSALRHSEAQSKEAGVQIRFARQLDPDLTIWRGVQAVFTEAHSTPVAAPLNGRAMVPDRPAPVLDQFRSELGEAVDEVYGDTHLGLELTGISYGTQDAVIESEIHETFPIAFPLLTVDGRELRRTAITAVDRVLRFRGHMRWFHRQLLVCAGDSPDEYPEQQTSAWLDELQIAFLDWLAELSTTHTPDRADLGWRRTFWRITRNAIRVGVEQAGPRAAIGRMEETESGATLHTSSRYEDWILSKLSEITGALPSAPTGPLLHGREAADGAPGSIPDPPENVVASTTIPTTDRKETGHE